LYGNILIEVLRISIAYSGRRISVGKPVWTDAKFFSLD